MAGQSDKMSARVPAHFEAFVLLLGAALTLRAPAFHPRTERSSAPERPATLRPLHASVVRQHLNPSATENLVLMVFNVLC